MTDLEYYIHKGGNFKFRAEVPANGKTSPWFDTKEGALAWILVQQDRIQPLVDAGYVITGVTRRKGW